MAGHKIKSWSTKMVTACRELVICTVANTPKPYFQPLLPWWPHFSDIPGKGECRITNMIKTTPFTASIKLHHDQASSLWLRSALWASKFISSLHSHTHTMTALSGFMTSALCTHPLSSPHPLWWCWGAALAAPAHLSFLPWLAPWSHECASTLGSLHGRLVAWPLHRRWDRDAETNLQHNVHKFGNGGTVPTQADWTALANASKWCQIIIFLYLSLSLSRG